MFCQYSWNSMKVNFQCGQMRTDFRDFFQNEIITIKLLPEAFLYSRCTCSLNVLKCNNINNNRQLQQGRKQLRGPWGLSLQLVQIKLLSPWPPLLHEHFVAFQLMGPNLFRFFGFQSLFCYLVVILSSFPNFLASVSSSLKWNITYFVCCFQNSMRGIRQSNQHDNWNINT